MKKPVNIITVLRTGGDFIYYDLELLSIYLERYCPNHKLYCLWDKTEEEMVVGNITLLPMKYKWPGWWAKMNLFSPELQSLRPYLYMDLDTAIVKNIQEFVDYLQKTHSFQFIGLEDFYHPLKLASGLMWIPPSASMQFVWDWFIKQPEFHIQQNRSDQDFLRGIIGPESMFYLQDLFSGITSFKPLPTRKWLEYVPQDISIVCFHGQPRICTAAGSIEWVRLYYRKQHKVLTE